ncbi:MAG TPA: hypothetical protein VHJ20_15615 [Polyangia bacterium]|nr:hypothetical protein [Polyangia bacterium]
MKGRAAALVARARAFAADEPARAAARVAFVVVALATIAWDLPSSFSWENDGVAPRDIFAGVAENLRPGHAFRYPLLHPLLLGLACLPALLPAALRASSWAFADVRAAILAVPVMTTCTIIGRLVALAMACVALATLGRIATTLAGVRAARWVEAFAATNLSFVYYARATNLDGPALMWSALAVEALAHVATRDRRSDLTRFAVFAAVSIATKDQAYATYVLVAPLALWLMARRRSVAAIGRPALAFIGTYALASGAVFNPTGFVTRLRTLTGSASGDYRLYERSLAGVATNLRDVLGAQADTYWPWPVVVLAWIGVAAAIVASARAARSDDDLPVARLLPLAAGLGALGAFVLAVGRNEHRFVLPLGFWLSFYAGYGLDRVVGFVDRRAVRASGVALVLLAAWPVAALAATEWGDARRGLEAWLASLPQGTTVETYGSLVYLPRFAPPEATPYRAARVGPDAPDRRNPLAALREVAGEIADVGARRPDVILLPEAFALPYLADPPRPGRALPPIWRADAGTTAFVRAAASDTLAGYRRCFVAEPHVPAWPGFAPRRIHVSTGMRTTVLARADRAEALCGVASAPRP